MTDGHVRRPRNLTHAAGLVPILAAATAVACAGPPPNEPKSPANNTAEAAPVLAPAPTPVLASAPAPAGSQVPGAWPFDEPPTEQERSHQLELLGKDPGPIRTNWTPPGRSERYGHAEALIVAPYDAVRARIVDFANYKDLAGPKFKKVTLVEKTASSADIYFQLPIMKGVVTIWYVTRFANARPGRGGEVVEGTFVKGNIKDVHFVFTVRKGAEATSTVLECDLLLHLNIPAPQGPIDETLRNACGDAIRNVRTIVTAGATPNP